MTVREILQAEHPILRGRAKRISKPDRSVQRLIDDMFETLTEANGLGLAAPQVGVPLRLAVIRIPEEYEEEYAGKDLVLINPEIIKQSDPEVTEEGCLSLMGYVGQVERFTKVTFKARDRRGKEYRIKSDASLAHAVQHEIDHLDGVLFFDRLTDPSTLRPVGAQPDEEQSDSS